MSTCVYSGCIADLMLRQLKQDGEGEAAAILEKSKKVPSTYTPLAEVSLVDLVAEALLERQSMKCLWLLACCVLHCCYCAVFTSQFIQATYMCTHNNVSQVFLISFLGNKHKHVSEGERQDHQMVTPEELSSQISFVEASGHLKHLIRDLLTKREIMSLLFARYVAQATSKIQLRLEILCVQRSLFRSDKICLSA